MKVGDYVRTNREIIKVSKIYERADGNAVFDDERGYQWYFSEIKKSSPNIIDLIEIGDLVRLFMEDDVEGEITNIFEVVAITNNKKEIGVWCGDEIEFFPIEYIRGIVTKEMFESVEYKIGGQYEDN